MVTIMAKDITKLIVNEKMRTAEIIFVEQELSKEDILPALNTFEDRYRDLNNDPRFDTVIIRADTTSVKLSLDFHIMIHDSLDVRSISKWEKIVTFFERLNKATVITLDGTISGSLLQIALICDYRVCTPRTKFKFIAIGSGFLPGMAVFRIAKYVGLGRAKHLLLTCKEFSSEEALALGIIDEYNENASTGIDNFLTYVNPKNLEAIIMARRLLHESYHCTYEDEIGDYLAAQSRCFTHLSKFNE